ncbi:hypothetical protein Pla175_45750 [Pirellulimonas nuda]|uniref:YhaN AAA domain-containing protein n=1 Tax=Pirellulimonas nuda TaxID=2528009 RepID=A0A518DI63_9BACT|nr:AAA family ATPase [Pirellulimonas nuda]QDU91155.1 hypothetical protein Pla175_45750 [Pirellulimonas nuda]
MKLTDLHIDGFGVWNDLPLKQLSPRITVFYGPNEAGKTTLMEFLRSMLYGMTDYRRWRYLPPVNGGRPGGRLGLLTDDGPFEATRYADRGDHDTGKVTVYLPGGESQGDRLLRESLDAVDEATFNNVFAVGLDEIQELGTLSGTDAAQWIYRLTSGLDRVSLYDVIQGLRTTRGKLLSPDENRSEITRLTAEREKLQTEIADLIAQGRRWSRLAVECAELDEQIEAARTEQKQSERTARRVEIAIGLKPLWIERANVEDQLLEYAGLYALKEGAIADLDELNGKIEEHRRQRDVLRGQRKQLLAESEELGVNQALVRNCCRLDALAEQKEWVESLQRQGAELGEEAKQLEQRLTSENNRLARLWTGDLKHAPDLTQAMVDDLEPHAVSLAAAERELDTVKAELDLRRGSEQKYRAKIESTRAAGDKLGLPTDLKQAGDLVARLRRRVQVEQRIDQAQRHVMDLDNQSHELLDRQVMPIELFALLGGVFVLGVVMCGVWWWYPTSAFGEWGGWVALIGIMGSVISLLVSYFLHDSAEEQFDAAHRQLEVVERQLEEAKRDKQKLDVELPMTDGSVVIHLQSAERHLAELEHMAPVENQRRAADQEVLSAEQQYESAKQRVAKALGEWQGRLRALGLPEKLLASDLKIMAGQYEQLTQLKLQAQNRREEIDRRQRELAAVEQRIVALAEEADLVIEEATPVEQLDALLSERRLQQSRIDHRQKLLDRAREIKEKEAKHHKSAETLGQRRETVFQQAGVEDEEAYRRLASDLAAAAKKTEKRDRLTREIAAAMGKASTEEDYAPMMAEGVIGRLEGQWEKLTAEHEAIGAKLDELSARRGAAEQEQKALAEDVTLADKQLALGCVETKLARAAAAWREQALLGVVLEEVRGDYETNRQPETLREASEYLKRLTKGRYTRIWTPLASDVLVVDNDAGDSLPVDVLSRGTREQLFLSIRLALIAMYARRGVALPMILDDVLVNFDVGRSRIAAQVLSDFARDGHQLLVFTCHEHVWSMFQDLDVDCRRLPDRFGAEVDVEEAPFEEVAEVEAIEEPEVFVEEAAEEEGEDIAAEYGELTPGSRMLEFEYGALAPRYVEREVLVSS